jgi:hypothetical protein
MIATLTDCPEANRPAAELDFLEMLPAIRRAANYAFRHLRRAVREETLQCESADSGKKLNKPKAIGVGGGRFTKAISASHNWLHAPLWVLPKPLWILDEFSKAQILHRKQLGFDRIGVNEHSVFSIAEMQNAARSQHAIVH